MDNGSPLQLGWKLIKKEVTLVQNSTVSFSISVIPYNLDGSIYSNIVNFNAKLTIVNHAKKVVLVLNSPDDIILSRDVNLLLNVEIKLYNILLPSGRYESDLLITNDSEVNIQYPLLLNINVVSSYGR